MGEPVSYLDIVDSTLVLWCGVLEPVVFIFPEKDSYEERYDLITKGYCLGNCNFEKYVWIIDAGPDEGGAKLVIATRLSQNIYEILTNYADNESEFREQIPPNEFKRLMTQLIEKAQDRCNNMTSEMRYASAELLQLT